MLLHSREHVHEEGDELEIAVRVLAGSEELYSGVGAERPVVVFARTVHALERLLMENHHEAVLARYLVHEVHHNLVLVVREVGLAVYRGELELVGRDFVVTGLERDSEAVPGYFQLSHERRHAGRNGAEVVVVKLLVLRRIVAHQGASGNHQVGAC